MNTTFEEWMEILRSAAAREGIALDDEDHVYRQYFDQKYTPRAVLLYLVEFN